jgi:hypothetical protein
MRVLAYACFIVLAPIALVTGCLGTLSTCRMMRRALGGTWYHMALRHYPYGSYWTREKDYNDFYVRRLAVEDPNAITRGQPA